MAVTPIHFIFIAFSLVCVKGNPAAAGHEFEPWSPGNSLLQKCWERLHT
jgi:hypothetical protein